ncbi:hypothetical protein CGRA01v4_02972 [Colletotrichum graminicola]|nr:hypothetical protein CGRA01v4_02972 [Colletotrichum graminicola]
MGILPQTVQSSTDVLRLCLLFSSSLGATRPTPTTLPCAPFSSVIFSRFRCPFGSVARFVARSPDVSRGVSLSSVVFWGCA